MFCESCGSQVPDGQAFCANCGKPLSQPVQPAAQPVQPVQQYAQPVAQPVYTQPVAQPQPVVQVQPAPVVVVQQQPAKRGNGMATAGLVFGILTLVFFWFPGLDWLFGLLGLIFSIVGVARKNVGGKGAAIAGLILTLLGSIISFVFFFAVLGASLTSYMDAAEQAAQTIDTLL